MKLALNCNRCRKPMTLTTSEEDRSRYPDREWFHSEQCRRSAYKDATGAHYIPITHNTRRPKRATERNHGTGGRREEAE
jgi:hypothetical protein